MRGRRARLTVLVLVLAVLLVGGLVTALLLNRAPAGVEGAGAGEDAVAGPGPAHGPVPVGQPITYDDQLQVRVVSLERERPGARPEMLLVAHVEVTNQTGERIDLFMMDATARLGGDQRGAARFSGASGRSPRAGGTLAPGTKATVTFAFQLRRPGDAGQVTLEVWPDWAHGPALFQGRAA